MNFFRTNLIRAHSYFESLRYNFSWDDYTSFLGGPFARMTLFIPVFGYLIIFNDLILEGSNFKTLTSDVKTTFFITPELRNRFVYFGLVFIAIANFVYITRRPFVLRYARNFPEYLSYATANFTFRDLNEIRGIIGRESHATLYGNDHLDQWDDFVALCGANYVENKRTSTEKPNFALAFERHQGLVRSLLLDHFTRYCRTRRPTLGFCLALMSLGYILLVIPSLDLFLRVSELTLRSFF